MKSACSSLASTQKWVLTLAATLLEWPLFTNNGCMPPHYAFALQRDDNLISQAAPCLSCSASVQLSRKYVNPILNLGKSFLQHPPRFFTALIKISAVTARTVNCKKYKRCLLPGEEEEAAAGTRQT